MGGLLALRMRSLLAVPVVTGCLILAIRPPKVIGPRSFRSSTCTWTTAPQSAPAPMVASSFTSLLQAASVSLAPHFFSFVTPQLSHASFSIHHTSLLFVDATPASPAVGSSAAPSPKPLARHSLLGGRVGDAQGTRNEVMSAGGFGGLLGGSNRRSKGDPERPFGFELQVILAL